MAKRKSGKIPGSIGNGDYSREPRGVKRRTRRRKVAPKRTHTDKTRGKGGRRKSTKALLSNKPKEGNVSCNAKTAGRNGSPNG